MGRSKKSFLERLVLEQEGEESVLEENLAFRCSEAAMLCEQWERRGRRRSGFHHWARGEGRARSDWMHSVTEGVGMWAPGRQMQAQERLDLGLWTLILDNKELLKVPDDNRPPQVISLSVKRRVKWEESVE